MNELNPELIIHRLDEISKKQDDIDSKIEDLMVQLAKVKTIENTVDNIKEWKDKTQEVISTSELKELKEWKKSMENTLSPTQLDQHLKEHDKLKTFRIQAMMVWAVAQALMAIAIFWDKMFG